MKFVAEDEDVVPSEILTMKLVQSQTSIPIPTLRRHARRRREEIVKDRDTGVESLDVSYRHVLAMHRINGLPLSQCWSLLSWWTKLRVI